jgi:hypothetical protein
MWGWVSGEIPLGWWWDHLFEAVFLGRIESDPATVDRLGRVMG